MASQGRRQRQRAATRERILEAAVELAREEGWPEVTMRKIAGRIEYTHAALYAYFATKEDLLLALFRDGTDRLVAALEEARDAAPSPERALVALAEAYWAFAWEYPELYQVLNGLGGISLAAPLTVSEGGRIGAVVGEAIRSLAARDGRDPGDVEVRVALTWATLHGLVSLSMAGRFSREQASGLVAQAVRDALVAWGARTPSGE